MLRQRCARQVEVMILSNAQWSLCYPTPIAYVEVIGTAALDGVDTIR